MKIIGGSNEKLILGYKLFIKKVKLNQEVPFRGEFLGTTLMGRFMYQIPKFYWLDENLTPVREETDPRVIDAWYEKQNANEEYYE